MDRLVVGLGNPGPRYERTRHNAGFRVVDRLARREGAIFQSARELEGYGGPDEFDFASARDRSALLVKPRTFMNLSGAVVAPVLAWLGLPPERCLVVYDDLDLPFGSLRIRPHGGPGSHNGMRSIVEHLAVSYPRLRGGSFPRLRLGIGAARTDAARHVLEDFSPEEERTMGAAVEEAADAIGFWLETGDLDACMTRFHSRWNQGAPPSAG